MNKILKVGLLAIAVALIIGFLNREPAREITWEYNYFIQQVENGKIETVQLSSDRSFAIVTRQDGTKIKVNLPATEEFYITDNNVDILVTKQENEAENLFFRAISSLFLPILLLLGFSLLLFGSVILNNKE